MCLFLFSHQINLMREAFGKLSPVKQAEVRQLLEDPLYQKLSQVAHQPEPKDVILEHYISLLNYKGSPHNRRNNITRALSKNDVPKLQAPIRTLFGRTAWMGRQLERPLRENDIPDKDRLRGKAQTWVIRSPEFLSFVLTTGLAKKGVLSALAVIEHMTHDILKEVVSTHVPRPVDPAHLIVHRHDQPDSPHWHMYVNDRAGVFAILNRNKGVGPRDDEFRKHGFFPCKNGKKVRNTRLVFEALRDGLKRRKVWVQGKHRCGQKQRVVYHLKRPINQSVWDYIDAAQFDKECQKWLTRVWSVISECDGVEMEVSEDTTTYGNKSLMYHGPGLWNNLPNHLKNARMDEVRCNLKTRSPNTDFN